MGNYWGGSMLVALGFITAAGSITEVICPCLTLLSYSTHLGLRSGVSRYFKAMFTILAALHAQAIHS